MINGDQERSRAGSSHGSRLRLLAAGAPARPHPELERMFPPALRAAQGESEPTVGHLPGREHAVRTHEGRAQVSGILRDQRVEEEVASGFRPAFSQQGEGVDRTLQVCSKSTVTQPTAGPTLRAALVPAPWTETREPGPGGRGRLLPYLSAEAGTRACGAAQGGAASRAPSGHRSGPGSSGRSRSSSAQRALPPGPASCVPSSCSCSSSCSSPPRDSSVSLPPAKSPARWQPSRRHCRVSGCPRLFPPACPGVFRSSLRRPPVLDGAAHGPAREPTSGAGPAGPRRSSGECGGHRLGSGKTWGAPGAPTWRPGLRASTGPKVSRGWRQCGGCRGTRKEELGVFLSSSSAALAPQLCKSGGTVYFLRTGIRVSDS